MITVYIEQQELMWTNDEGEKKSYRISTALKGIGQIEGSNQTPLGEHRICAKIGDGLPVNAVFKGRRWTGEIYGQTLGQAWPQRDWILSRILWLQGMESGVNRGGQFDSKRRYIYVHGTNEEHLLGHPYSHGCVRMSNQDVIDLFNRVIYREKVLIKAN